MLQKIAQTTLKKTRKWNESNRTARGDPLAADPSTESAAFFEARRTAQAGRDGMKIHSTAPAPLFHGAFTVQAAGTGISSHPVSDCADDGSGSQSGPTFEPRVLFGI